MDMKRRKFFKVHSRNQIDSFTADSIYTLHDYQLDFLARYNELARHYEDILERRKTPLIIDCGANIGLAARYFAEEFPAARVIALEPDVGNCLAARNNCSRLGNVTIRQCAVGSTVGLVSICNEDADPNAFRTIRNGSDGNIEVCTLNELVDSGGDVEVFIIKIDVEGFEEEIFSANTEWIHKTPLIIIELHDWMLPGTANSRSFLRAMSEEHRDFVHRGENIFSIANIARQEKY
jgi:FkbM family methyltransferase